ncbi:MAG TPA: hypothetical protein VGX37_03685 [Allosphingosinicella sp.]|jgi:hypothetical protein|nr:hypothetical protein [Allosphingosinicella sp.]
MTRSANEVMQDIVYAAIVDALAALKAASKGVPNTLLRDINAIHVNSTFADLPRELQAAITASVRSAFTRLLKEGYSVTNPAAPAPVRREPQHPPRGPRPGDRGHRRDGPGPRKPPGGGNRPSGGRPKPRGR